MSLLQKHSAFNFDSLFDHLWAPLRHRDDGEKESFVPRVDIKEKKGNYEISAELPGVDKSDVKVTLDDGLLSIEAESNSEDTEEKDGKVIRQERRYGKFIRSFSVGSGVTESDVKAEFKNGVLKLEVPRTQEPEREQKRIDIK